jgi:hypothetical protein
MRSPCARRRMARSLSVALVSVLVLAFLPGCRPLTEPTPTPVPTAPATPTPTPVPVSGTLRLWMAPLDRIDPIRSRNEGFLAVSTLVYEPLFSLDENAEPLPRLCRSAVPMLDGRIWVLTLVDDVLFHDGSPFLAADAAASADLWLAHGSGRLHDALVALQPVFRTNGEHALVVQLASPEKALPRLLRFPVVPASYATARSPDPLVPIPGTGRFHIVEYVKGTGLRLERVLPAAGAIERIAVLEFADVQAALVAFHSDLLDALPLDEVAFRTLRLRKGLKIARCDGDTLLVAVLGTSKGRTLSDPGRGAAIRRRLATLFTSDEFLRNMSLFPSARGLSSGTASLVFGRTSVAETPSPEASPTVAPWTGTLDILAVTGSFEAEVGAGIVAFLRADGIAATLRTLPEAECMDAFASGRYDIAIRTRTMPTVPGAPATEIFASRTGTPVPDPLIRSEGLLLGPRVFGEPIPCADEIYRGIEDTWVWSGS